MSDVVCQALFVRGSVGADLSIVEGTLDNPDAGYGRWRLPYDQPGNLEPIIEMLDLPVVAVVSCAGGRDQPGWFHLPALPPGTDAILLDEIDDPEAFERIRRMVRLTYDLPVLAGVGSLPKIRENLAGAPRETRLPEDLIDPLARSFLRFADLEAIAELANRRPAWPVVSMPNPCGQGGRCGRVAYAQDEAFGRYFPDTLEAIEALGVELIEFSPLRDEQLPDDVDLVMVGCGIPDRYADELTANASLIASLRQHVCRGRRIYSEGGGTAYLGGWMILEDGRRVRGAGILPFDAQLLADPQPPKPVERILCHDSWIGPTGTRLRGYRTGRWQLLSNTESLECPNCYGQLTPEGDLTFHHHAVGSLVHLHLGHLPEVVNAFAGLHRPSLRRPSSRG
jgi:cobyrinic acid a,c-diamide synthase